MDPAEEASDIPPPVSVEHEPELQNAPIPHATAVKHTTKIKSALRTPQLASFLKSSPKNDAHSVSATQESSLDEPFTEEKLRETWNAYAEQRRKFQAEYQMLTQPYRLEDNVIIVELLSPVHETMLDHIKSELTGFLREHLRNHTIQVTGQLQTDDEKKIIYTNREKFDFLVEKNPMLRELRDRLGLDTDF